MKCKPDDEILAALFQARSAGRAEEPDLNLMARWASGGLAPDTEAELDRLFFLGPDLGGPSVALRDYLRSEETATEDASLPNTEPLRILAVARWRGLVNVGCDEGDLYRVSHRGGEIRFPPWIDRVFSIGKRMMGSLESGIWPTNEVSFVWPAGDPLLHTSVRCRQGETLLSIRCLDIQQSQGHCEKVEIEYWQGDRWAGVERIHPDNPEVCLHLKPKWPYLLVVPGEEPLALRVAWNRVGLSAVERRMAAMLRILSGDVGGGSRLVRQDLVPRTPTFDWGLTLLRRSLPPQVAQAGFAMVREASVEEEQRTGSRELFLALAAGWVGKRDEPIEFQQISALLAEQGPVAKGFRLALEGAYEEALGAWAAVEETKRQEPYVQAARFLATRLCSEPKDWREKREPLPTEDLEAVFRLAEALRECEKEEENNLDRLADSLSKVCR